jgi:hypothetical protein
MIKLVAHDGRDGLSLACDDQRQFFMLTPPFSDDTRQSLDEPEALRLILDQGVPLDAREFASWDDVTASILPPRG